MSTRFTKVLRIATILSLVVLIAATTPLEAQKKSPYRTTYRCMVRMVSGWFLRR
jgi:hypothetical protein